MTTNPADGLVVVLLADLDLSHCCAAEAPLSRSSPSRA